MIHNLVSALVAFALIQVNVELEEDLSLPKWLYSLLSRGIKGLQYLSCVYLMAYCVYYAFVELKIIK